VQSNISSTFRRNILPPFSGSKNKNVVDQQEVRDKKNSFPYAKDSKVLSYKRIPDSTPYIII
jgi:hypothetical protein